VRLLKSKAHEHASEADNSAGAKTSSDGRRQRSHSARTSLAAISSADACHIITCEEPRLQFSNPVPVLPQSQILIFRKPGLMLERTEHTTFKKTKIVEDAVPRAITDVVRTLKAVPSEKLVIVY
jgi:hypothetical protein